MSTRYAARRDTAEAGIVTRLRALGATVTPLDGNGVPDLLIAYKGQWLVAEVKTGKGALRPSQIDWARRQVASCPVLRTPEEAETWLRSIRPTEADIADAWEDAHQSRGGA
jgi:hypothetical protein